MSYHRTQFLKLFHQNLGQSGHFDRGAGAMLDDYEEFSESQLNVLKRYVTNTRGNVFALRNLPEVLKGALFSRYSRSSLGLRSLLLKEFILNGEETGFDAIVAMSQEQEDSASGQLAAIKKAQNFYDRILDGYGDDSIGELGGAHLAIENISMLAAKRIEDCRIGGSPLEKSTRYIYFDQKVQGEYLYYREPILMTSAYRDIYIETCNHLFETYSQLIAPLTEQIGAGFPRGPKMSKAAYTAALRAKVLDCLRGLLPAGTLTNMGVYGNGRFFEQMLHKLHCDNLAELQETARRGHEELSKVIPSFVRRSETSHRHHQGYASFYESMGAELKLLASQHGEVPGRVTEPGVRLVSYDPESVSKVLSAMLYPHMNVGLKEMEEYCRQLPEEEVNRILDAGCGARENRRHKSPRALEHAEFTFEVIGDFGAFRDLHRHRLLTQERQLLSCDYGYYIPQELVGTEMEGPYREALQKAKEVYDAISCELPEEAQYVVPMAYNIRWYFHVNLRALQWLCELRSQPQGHTSYRYIAQGMAREVCRVFPHFERYFKFVDYEGYELGRLEQEQRKVEKMKER